MDILSLPILLLFAVLGSSAGFLAGLLGIGGGVILVPLFLVIFGLAGFPPDIIVHAAFGTSLAIIIPTSVSSTLGHRKRGNVDWHQVGFLALGGVGGALIGAALAARLSGDWLKGLFGVMQILVGVKMFLFKPRLPPIREENVSSLPLLGVGLVGGAFSAFFGVGGGVVAVPLMVIALQLPIQLAVGNSSALIVISSLTGALSYIAHGWHIPDLPASSLGYVNLLVAAIVAPFSILCARLGVRVASRIAHAKLVSIFSLLLILIGLRMLYKGFF